MARRRAPGQVWSFSGTHCFRIRPTGLGDCPSIVISVPREWRQTSLFPKSIAMKENVSIAAPETLNRGPAKRMGTVFAKEVKQTLDDTPEPRQQCQNCTRERNTFTIHQTSQRECSCLFPTTRQRSLRRGSPREQLQIESRKVC